MSDNMKVKEAYSHWGSVFLAISLLAPSQGSSFNRKTMSSTDVIQFCKNNGMRYLTFTALQSSKSDFQQFLKGIHRESKLELSLRTRFILTTNNKNNEEYVDDSIKFGQDTLVILSSDNTTEWEQHLRLVSTTKIMSAVFVVVQGIKQEQVEEMVRIVRQLSQNLYFYLVYINDIDEEQVLWKRVMSVQGNHHISMQSLEFDQLGKIVRNYDMQGMHIDCLTLSWSPYITLSDCNQENGKNCRSEGYLPDLMNIVGKMLNFTWHCDKEPNNNWGLVPISGPPNATGEWGGIIGNVTRGNYPLGLCFWFNLESRIGMFDYVIVGHGIQYVMALIPQLPEYDSELFTRPFRNEAWWMIGMMTMVIIVCFIISWIFSRHSTKRNSLRLIRSVAWLMYLLIIIYYGGALKMFFTTELTIPFDSRRDVMNAYPEWKMKFRSGMEKIFHDKAEDGDDELYVEFWERFLNTPEEVQYKSIAEGIREINEDQIVIHISDKSLRQYFKYSPGSQKPKTFPSEGENLGEYMIVTENSPLASILNYGFRILYENGVMHLLETKWMGKDLSDDSDGKSAAFALTHGQVMMVFSILCAAMGMAVAVLGGECIFVSCKQSAYTRTLIVNVLLDRR